MVSRPCAQLRPLPSRGHLAVGGAPARALLWLVLPDVSPAHAGPARSSQHHIEFTEARDMHGTCPWLSPGCPLSFSHFKSCLLLTY